MDGSDVTSDLFGLLKKILLALLSHRIILGSNQMVLWNAAVCVYCTCVCVCCFTKKSDDGIQSINCWPDQGEEQNGRQAALFRPELVEIAHHPEYHDIFGLDRHRPLYAADLSG